MKSLRAALKPVIRLMLPAFMTKTFAHAGFDSAGLPQPVKH
jgi:hypothetical protein